MKKNVMKTLVFALLVSAGFTLASCDDENKVNPDVEIVDAVDYSKRWRFVYEASDRWSPVFI